MFGLGLTEMVIFGVMFLMMIGVPLVVVIGVMAFLRRQDKPSPPDEVMSSPTDKNPPPGQSRQRE